MATRIVLGTCHHDCPDSCGWVATVEDGRRHRAARQPGAPVLTGRAVPQGQPLPRPGVQPRPCAAPARARRAQGRGAVRAGVVGRRARPDRRADARGDRPHGGETVLPWSSAGNQSLLSIGALPTASSPASAPPNPPARCAAPPPGVGTAATYGDGRGHGPDGPRHSRFIILWGTNTRMTNRHLWPFITEARRNGATVVVIDPVRTATARSADWFVQPLPGTDAALALAMMHVIVRDGLVDTDYVERHTTGYDRAARSRRRVDARARGRDVRPRRDRDRAPCRCIRNDPAGRDPAC